MQSQSDVLGTVRELKRIGVEMDFLILEDRSESETVEQRCFAHFNLICARMQFEEVRGHGLDSGAIAEQWIIPNPRMDQSDHCIPDRRTIRILGLCNRDLLASFICQKRCSAKPHLLHFSPSSSSLFSSFDLHSVFKKQSYCSVFAGVHLDSASDGLGQNFRSPHIALHDDHNDLLFISHGICEAADPQKAARTYREEVERALAE